MKTIKEALQANLKASELRSALFNKDSTSDITIADIYKAEEVALELTKAAIIELDSLSNEQQFNDARESIIAKSKEIEKISDNFKYLVNNLTQMELSSIGLPVGSVVSLDDKISCELSINLPIGTKLYTTQLIDPSKVVDLTIGDIKSIVNMGNLENILIPVIEKVIQKFKQKNNISL